MKINLSKLLRIAVPLGFVTRRVSLAGPRRDHLSVLQGGRRRLQHRRLQLFLVRAVPGVERRLRHVQRQPGVCGAHGDAACAAASEARLERAMKGSFFSRPCGSHKRGASSLRTALSHQPIIITPSTQPIQRMLPVARERPHLGGPPSRLGSFSPFPARQHPRAVDLIDRMIARSFMRDLSLRSADAQMNGSPSMRATAYTPGTFESMGTCSVS